MLSSPLTVLRGVGPKRAARLREAGCSTVKELLWCVPTGYEDRSSTQPISELEEPAVVTLAGRLRKVRAIRLRGRRSMVRAELLDGSGSLAVVWFNRPYLARQLDPQAEYLLHGTLRATRGDALELLNPSCERCDRLQGQGRWTPIYSSLAPGLGPALVRDLVQRALPLVRQELASACREVDCDPLPRDLRERYGLPTLLESWVALHQPADEADGEALKSRSTAHHHRLIYGELLRLQLFLASQRREVRQIEGHRYGGANEAGDGVRRELPFRLTAAQERVVGEIRRELHAGPPMRRLLQGDVGSGKTVVAALAIAEALASGHQALFMAPTQLLAEQHRIVLGQWLDERWRVELLTGSTPHAKALRERLRHGEIDLLVGTHTLFQDSVNAPRLALVVIDEQHRFGVDQRQRLLGKGARSDLLVMTATPIPRSLALTAYGDLDVSLLNELPPGRRPVMTELAPASLRAAVVERLRRAAQAGEQGYVVYPLIEASQRVTAAAVEKQGRELQEALGEVSSALLHGRMPVAERLAVVRAFAAGQVRVLIATTVIEVGIDVPQANFMVIESAERFGLAQLHQLRGRVGRGERQARCIALHGKLSDEARRRLETFAATTDGFEIAEADLALRGPGDLTGTRQAGLASLRVARPVIDGLWLERARQDAGWLLDNGTTEELAKLMGSHRLPSARVR